MREHTRRELIEDATAAWRKTVAAILSFGDESQPRGRLTFELLNWVHRVDMCRPVLMIPERKLSYQFMAAEAYWILTGDDTVAGIVPFNERIAQFSDDGVRFFGAYGPKVTAQLPYVVAKLEEDPFSRQAGLTIWRESPPATRDVPCTVAMFFTLRRQELHASVYMRSSDAWLGLPYDVFNFSMVAHHVCGLLNNTRASRETIKPGVLTVVAANSHLYSENWEAARRCITAPPSDQSLTPKLLWNDHRGQLEWLAALRHSKPGDSLRWWEVTS